MLATMTVQNQYTGMPQTPKNYSPLFTFTSNSAGGPLPVIPRRTISPSPSCPLPLSKHSEKSSSASSPSTYVTNRSTMEASTSIVTITPATPPKEDADSPLIHGKRRRRDERTPNPNTLYPPEFSTPIPSLISPSSSSLMPTATVIGPSFKYGDTTNTLESPRSPLLYTPGMPLRFSIESLRKASNTNGSLGFSFQASNSSSTLSQSSSTSSISTYSVGSSQGSPSLQPPLIRKKSGQVVRSSLKSSSSYSYSRSGFGLNISSPVPSFPSSKSEPSTPTGCVTPTTSKMVHFDESLDQVKLFLAGQKPLAVSREGSPVDTDDCETATSGTECEIPKTRSSSSTSDGDKKSMKLVMHTNIPPRSAPFPPSSRNVVLESLTISPDEKSVLGRVLVRNIAFEKRVSARFSLDGWSTISEVTAKWEEGVLIGRTGKAEWDRFGFTVWLGDLRLGEQDTRLEMAVRYGVENRRDMWDNNGGGNYVATFSKSKLPNERGKGKKAPQRRKPDPIPFSDDELSDLLEKAVSKKSKSNSLTTPGAKGKSKTSKSSSSTSITMTQYPSGPSHTRTRSFPFSTSSAHSPINSAQRWMEMSPSSPSPPSKWLPPMHGEKLPPIETPKKSASTTTSTLGSPRDLADDAFHPHPYNKLSSHSDTEEGLQHARVASGKMGHHQRGGPCDVFAERTSVGMNTPESTDTALSTPTLASSSRFHSLTGFDMSALESRGFRIEESSATLIATAPSPMILGATPVLSPSDGEESTSTLLATPTSSRSSTLQLERGQDVGLLSPSLAEESETYSELLEKFCFFTGSGSPRAQPGRAATI